MATTAAEPIFLDTNVLIYATNTASPWHPAASAAIEQARRDGRPLVASTQIMREYLAVATRPGTMSAPLAIIFSAIDAFRQAFTIVDDSQAVFSTLCDLVRSVQVSGKQIHDANIVATMLHAGVPTLLTGNVADFRRFGHLITVVPLTPPA
jgi:predicted nucleic acid-binding protein